MAEWPRGGEEKEGEGSTEEETDKEARRSS